jgi:FtsH-binding integral membrane protein
VGPDRNTHIRNVAIILALALAVWLLPGGDTASVTVGNLIGIVFIGGLLFFGYRMYMERRTMILDLEDRQRAILYASLALGTITLVATRRMWDSSSLGALLWLALLGLAFWGLLTVWRAYREY